jgi:uncharacterized protein YkwD
MPDGARASIVRRIVASCTRARVAGGVAFVGALTLAAVGISSAEGAAGAGRDYPLPALAAAPADASVLGSLGLAPHLTAADGTALSDIERYLQIASLPTATAVPPTATAVPPTPTSTLAPPPPVAPAPTSTPVPPPPPAPTAPAGPPPQSSGLDTSPMDAYAQALFDDTNRRRAGAGLPTLRANGQLVGIARIRSHDMADHNYFAHVSPITGDNAFTLMDKYGVPYGWAGENLAKNNYPDNQCVSVADEALWNSPPHRENILSPNYTDMGIALVIDPTGMKYFTIIFTGPA